MGRTAFSRTASTPHPMADSGARLNVNVAIYLDESYAVPATVMVRSLLDNAMAGDRLHLFILAIGLTDEVKRTMAAGWPRERLDLRWINLDRTLHGHRFSKFDRLSKAAHARLLIDRCLPPDVERVITIDCDGIVLGDVGELWRRPAGGHCLIAVRDPCVPRLGDDSSAPVQRLSSGKDAPYFNSGLMVVDLKAWRGCGITERCLALIERCVGRSDYAEQSFLNAVLRGAWEPLPLRWNCNARHLAIHAHPSLRGRVYPFVEVTQARERPSFIHFLSRRKPWQPTPFHPHRELYHQYLQKTAWAREKEPESSRRRREIAIHRHLFPWSCWRQATILREKLGFPPDRLADLRHLLSEIISPNISPHG